MKWRQCKPGKRTREKNAADWRRVDRYVNMFGGVVYVVQAPDGSYWSLGEWRDWAWKVEEVRDVEGS